METIKLYNNDADLRALRELAARMVTKSPRYLLYVGIFAAIGLMFLGFAVYAAVYLFGMGFQLGMLIYLAVPLLGAGLTVVFMRRKKEELIEHLCEEKNTVIRFTKDRMVVEGQRSEKLVRKPDGNAVFEKPVFAQSGLLPFSYELRLDAVRYYAYDAGRFRLILGAGRYPELLLTENEAYFSLCDALERRNIRRTGYLK